MTVEKISKLLMLILVLLLVMSPYALAEEELEDGNFYTLYDEEDNVLLQTGIVINVGDKFIDHKNHHYIVYRVDEKNYKAWARKLGDDETSEPSFSEFAQLEGADERRIGLYYTHSGESYVPTEGYAQTDRRRGGIYKVGGVLAQEIEKHDIEVINSQRTHFPYSGSYRRSRRTATELLSQDLDAIFDVHRDATPPQAYLETIDGERVTQILLVVGRQNPAHRVNEEFALQLKAVADEVTPDLVKGIFYGRGSYNQDLHPRALLLEIGAHTNRREDAERGAALFADIIAQTLYGDLEVPDAIEDIENEEIEDLDKENLNAQIQSTVDSGGPGTGGLAKGFITVILLTVIGGGGYLLISVGDTREIEKKIRGFFTKEFANTLKGKNNRKRR